MGNDHVQDVVNTGDDYPLSQGHLWQTQNLPFHIAIDTKNDSTRVGNNGGLKTGGSLWYPTSLGAVAEAQQGGYHFHQRFERSVDLRR